MTKIEDMMMKVRLVTRDGGFVAEIQMPRFKLMPEVLIWGERFFWMEYGSGQDGREGIPDGTLDTATYSEIFAYYVPPVPIYETKKQG